MLKINKHIECNFVLLRFQLNRVNNIEKRKCTVRLDLALRLGFDST